MIVLYIINTLIIIYFLKLIIKKEIWIEIWIKGIISFNSLWTDVFVYNFDKHNSTETFIKLPPELLERQFKKEQEEFVTIQGKLGFGWSIR